jgi:hypothetical protein
MGMKLLTTSKNSAAILPYRTSSQALLYILANEWSDAHNIFFLVVLYWVRVRKHGNVRIQTWAWIIVGG